MTSYTFEQYQTDSKATAIYPEVGNLSYVYPVIGLSGEVGEVSEKIKKIIRDKEGVVSEEDKQAIKKELGDVLWYLSQIATSLDISLKDIAASNIEKLQARQKKGTLQGSGDNR